MRLLGCHWTDRGQQQLATSIVRRAYHSAELGVTRLGRRTVFRTAMYATCIFCHAGLGANDSIEHFPVGSRLAFDAEKGRLWAVCPTCGRWNLSPLEERWEAVEECERRFRATTVRTSTDNVGLARLRDGTDLVRVGRPLRPEFAAWRYGRQFSGRQMRAVLSGVSLTSAALSVGLALATAPWMALAGVPLIAAAEYRKMGLPRGLGFFDNKVVQRTLRDDEGTLMLTGDRILDRVRMRPSTERDAPAGALHVRTLRMPLDGRDPLDVNALEPVEHLVTGPAALRAMAVLMARANAGGGSRMQVRRAVQQIEEARTPERFLERAEDEARRRGAGYRNVWDMPPEIRFAMEMAAHEDAERRAMEGELAELERHWREAESLAAIADALPLSPAVEAKLDALRAVHPARPGAPAQRLPSSPSRRSESAG